MFEKGRKRLSCVVVMMTIMILLFGMSVSVDGLSSSSSSMKRMIGFNNRKNHDWNSIRRVSSSFWSNNNKNDNNDHVPPPTDNGSFRQYDDDDDDDDSSKHLWWSLFSTDTCVDETEEEDYEEGLISSSSSSSSSSKLMKREDVMIGSASSWRTSVEYWSRELEKWKERLLPKSKKKKRKLTKEEELIQKLQRMPVQRVVAPNSTILTPQVLTRCGHASHLISHPMTTDKIQLLAKHIKHFYASQGHILATVTGATLNGDTATVELKVQEPTVSSHQPIHLQFVKAMIQHPNDPNQLLTYRQYRHQHNQQAKYAASSNNRQPLLPLSDCNVTYVPTSTGATKPHKLAKALRLTPRQSFVWDSHQFQKVSKRFFSRILQASPRRMNDGSVQLYLVGEELPFRNLEYGVSKNLYTGQWEGELQLQHSNLFGGGEQFDFNMKKDGIDTLLPSVSIQYSHQPLDAANTARGHSIRLFHESIASTTTPTTTTTPKKNTATVPDDTSGQYQPLDDTTLNTDTSNNSNNNDALLDQNKEDNDGLLIRKGGTITIWNPIRSVASSTAAAERILKRDGNQESILSTNMHLGPFTTSHHPTRTRANVQSTWTIGSRWLSSNNHNSQNQNNAILLPYSILSATTRQILPLFQRAELALSQQLQTSSRHLPRHEANAMGIASRIRGFTGNLPLYQSIQTTTELRIPLPSLPPSTATGLFKIPYKLLQDTSILFFHDYRIGTPYTTTTSTSSSSSSSQTATTTDDAANDIQSSYGMGIRKSLQGLPLKYDISYNTKDQNVRAFFGLGHDFTVQ